ncbi:MAG TPA: hypothetical protein VM103_01975 [Candidatus Paceibacterota bacterium]|nr:hypothetical protein [Candidatus Paceibacterota bacterium]
MKIDFITDINKGFAEALGYAEVDAYMIKVLWWHCGVFTLLAFANSVLKVAAYYPNPFAWRVISSTEALVTVGIGLVALLVPVLLRRNIQNHYMWRIVITLAFLTYSYLFVFISGGSIEMHFHFFIIAALIVMYADWRLGWILLVLTGLHHIILNYVQPGWVYFYGRNDFSVISHAVPVLIAVIFTTKLCEVIRGGVMALDLTNRGILAQTQGDRPK